MISKDKIVPINIIEFIVLFRYKRYLQNAWVDTLYIRGQRPISGWDLFPAHLFFRGQFHAIVIVRLTSISKL